MLEKYGKPRVFIIFYCLLAALLIVEAVVFHSIYNTVNYKTHRLSLREVSDSGVLLADSDGNEMRMTNYSPYGAANSFVELDCIITYLNEEIRYSFSFDAEKDPTYVFSDGSTVTEPAFGNIYADGVSVPMFTAIQIEEKELVNKLRSYLSNYIGIGVFVGYVFFGLIMLLAANVNLFYPEKVFRLRYALAVNGGEPTDVYLFMAKISSFALTALVYFGMYLVIFRA